MTTPRVSSWPYKERKASKEDIKGTREGSVRYTPGPRWGSSLPRGKKTNRHYKALCTRRLFVQRAYIAPILVRQCLNCRGTDSHQGHHGHEKILVYTHVPQHAVKGRSTMKIIQYPEREKHLNLRKKHRKFREGTRTRNWFCVHFETR